MKELNYIESIIKENSDAATLVISAGDMFQGSGLSNYRYGLDMVNIMNMIGFNAMSVGNHEFDWGLSTVLNYNDGDLENGEANFPFLGCNILYKETDLQISYEPYYKKDITINEYKTIINYALENNNYQKHVSLLKNKLISN